MQANMLLLLLLAAAPPALPASAATVAASSSVTIVPAVPDPGVAVDDATVPQSSPDDSVVSSTSMENGSEAQVPSDSNTVLPKPAPVPPGPGAGPAPSDFVKPPPGESQRLCISFPCRIQHSQRERGSRG